MSQQQKPQSTLQMASLFTGLVFSAAAAQAGQKVIVHMKSPSTFRAVTQQLKAALQSALNTKDVFGNQTLALPAFPASRARVLSSFERLNMIVVDVGSAQELAALKQNPEVSFAEVEVIYPAPTVPLDESEGPSDSLSSQVAQIIPWGIDAVKSPQAWGMSRGEGAKVVILDTGIDRDHPNLKNQIFAAKNFVTVRPGTSNAAPSPANFLLAALPMLDLQPTDAPPYDYYDVVGHGTHVAGTIAGEDNGMGVVGVAPQAKILPGRVCGKFGCSSVAIINGIDWAIQQGADVISMSLGGPTPSDAQKEALQSAENAGVVVVAASGNDCPATGECEPTISYPAAYATALAVGAVDRKLNRAYFSQFGPELGVVAPGVDVLSSVPRGSGRASKVSVMLNGQAQEVTSTSFVGSPEVLQEMNGTLVAAGLGKPEDFPANVRGNIAFVQRGGGVSFADKLKEAVKAGASAMLVYNNEPGLISGALTTDGSTAAIPVVMIEQVIGDQVKAAIDAGTTETASLQTSRTDFAAFQGTSMATPHVSGVAALVRAVNKKLTPAQVRDIIKKTSTFLKETPHNEYGAGIVNAEAAVGAARATQSSNDDDDGSN